MSKDTYEVEEGANPIEDGQHEGTIVKVERREQGGFDYTDLKVQVDGTKPPIVLKCGFPSKMTPMSSLSRMYELFTGEKVKVGVQITKAKMNEAFIGKKVEFTTETDVADNGARYARIVPKSLVPA